MSVSSIETLDGTNAASTSATVTVTTSLVPTDRLVVLYVKSGVGGVPVISGLGTWTNLQSHTITRDAVLVTMTGATGGGNVTINPGTSGASGDYVLFVLRGSGGGQVDVFGSQSARVSSGGAATTADITSATAGMFVCASGTVDPGAGVVFPGASTLPASGWTTTRTATNTDGKFIHQVLSSGSTVRMNVTNGTGTGAALSLVGVFSEAATTPPLASTFVGWGNPIF